MNGYNINVFFISKTALVANTLSLSNIQINLCIKKDALYKHLLSIAFYHLAIVCNI